MSGRYELLGRADLKAASVPKSILSDKRDRGTALIISGNSRFHGAPVLSALASMRIGAGYVKLYVPKAIINPVRSLSPNIIVGALGSNSITCNKEILGEVERADAVAIGMGIGRLKDTISSATKIIQVCASSGVPVVVDADAIISLRRLGRVGSAGMSIVATPHDGEFFRLTGVKPDRSNIAKRASTASAWAGRLGIIIVLKGHYTIVTDGKRTRIGKPVSSALATMGTGDVLSGIICGYMATGAGPFEAACAGVYLHYRIGDILARRRGRHIIAVDVVDAIPSVIKEFDKSIH